MLVVGVAAPVIALPFNLMGFKLPSTCSPAMRLDCPGSLTIKISPLGAEANSFSSLASKGSTLVNKVLFSWGVALMAFAVEFSTKAGAAAGKA